MNHRSHWSSDMEDTLISLIKINTNINEICNIMGRTKHSIDCRLKLIAIKMIKNNELTENICINTGLNLDTISELYAHFGGVTTQCILNIKPVLLQPVFNKVKIIKPISEIKINTVSWPNKIKDQITGKKVLIIDLETTGLALDKGKYHHYFSNTNFDTCRIVEIGFFYSDNFDPDSKNIHIHNYLRKPTDFNSIPQEATNVHGITYEQTLSNGYTLGKILSSGLYDILNKIDVFVSHNTNFDFNVLLNELYRLKQFKTIKRLISLQKNKNVICTCKCSGYKKLTAIYSNIFNKEVKNAHRAGDDVKTLLEIILNKQYDGPEYKTTFITHIDNNTINVNDPLFFITI